MLKKILLAVVAVVVVFALFVASRPAAYKIERSTLVNAPASAIYPRVAAFPGWTAWSPWAHLDPAMKVDYAGPAEGTGAIYHWKGNDKVGEGRMTITAAEKDQLLRIKLEFIKPWEQTSDTVFRFQPEGAGTRVTWSMTGDRDFVGKLFGVFMDMDAMVGPDFEKGLAALKRESEKAGG
jgi:hypothetical protein